MAYIEADCSLIKKDGQIIGVSLIAQPQMAAERYCASMPKQLVDGESDIKFGDGKVIFPGEVSFSIEEDDSSALQAILNGEKKLGLYKDGFMTPGFKIVLEGMEKDGEKTKLTRL